MLTRLNRLLLLALPVKRKRGSVNAVVVNAVANSGAAVEIDVAATGVVAVTNEAETAGVVVNAVVVAVVVDKRPAQ
jgi:hypothetical protein